METILCTTMAVVIIVLCCWILRLRKELKQDPQTRVMNKRAFTKDLTARFASKRNPEHFVSVIFIDLNDFKSLNDTLGHAEGDRVIGELVDALRQTLRQEDRIGTSRSSIGRFGGDEFYVSLETKSLEDLDGVVGRLRAEAARRNVSISLGRAAQKKSAVTDPDVSVSALLQLADRAMYADKQAIRANNEPTLPS